MRTTKHKSTTIILLVFFVIYLIVLFKITIFRYPNIIPNILKGELHGVRSLNLIPFVSIAEYFRFILRGEFLIGCANLMGNMIIFFPLGYLFAVLLPKMRKLTRILVLAITFSLVIEGFQYAFAVGAADVDDVILNTLGGVVGYWVYALFSNFSESKKYAVIISALMIAFTCTGLLVGNNYNNEDLIQGDVKEINNESIVISRTYRRLIEEENTSINESFEVAFSENCKITLVDILQNGEAVGDKTIEKNDIIINDLIVLKKFLINDNGIYMAEEVEIHRAD